MFKKLQLTQKEMVSPNRLLITANKAQMLSAGSAQHESQTIQISYLLNINSIVQEHKYLSTRIYFCLFIILRFSKLKIGTQKMLFEYIQFMIKSSLLQIFALSFFLVNVQPTDSKKQEKQFEIAESIIGLLLLAICAAIYYKAKGKVKYVEFESFQIEQKVKGITINTEAKIGLPKDMSDSHEVISEQKQFNMNSAPLSDRKKRKRKVDRIQKKQSESNLNSNQVDNYRDSFIQVK